MKTVLISGAFTADNSEDREKNIKLAAELGEHILSKMKCLPVIPHTNTGAMFGRVSEDKVLTGYLKLLTQVDCVYMLPNWERSKGATSEHQLAKEIAKPCFYDLISLYNWVEHSGACRSCDGVGHFITEIKGNRRLIRCYSCNPDKE